jgi:hypothetical protein
VWSYTTFIAYGSQSWATNGGNVKGSDKILIIIMTTITNLNLKNLKTFAPANYWRIPNKNADKIYKNIGASKYIQKHWRIQKPWRMQKHCASKNLGGFKNIGASKNLDRCKNIGASKNLGACKNIGASKNLGGCKNIGAYRNIGIRKKTRHPPMLVQQEK